MVYGADDMACFEKPRRVAVLADHPCEREGLLVKMLNAHRRCSFEKARMSIFGERRMSLAYND